MWGWLLAAAWAGPMGPWEGGTADTGIDAAPACDEQYPFALVQLPERPALYQRWNAERSYGTAAMVDVLIEASGKVAAAWPDADPIFVGDLSTRRGGPLPPHRYHGDGRSADIGLFASGGTQPKAGFVPLWGAQLDLERTWTLIEALLATGRVEHILLDQSHIRRLTQWLSAEGRLTDAEIAAIFPPLDTPRLWAMEGIVRHAPRHVDHLHVRLRCDR